MTGAERAAARQMIINSKFIHANAAWMSTADYMSSTVRWSTVMMEKRHYQFFVRLYNRRKRQTSNDMLAAGYNWVCYNNFHQMINMFEWCESNLPKGSYVYDFDTAIWFAYTDDAVQCKLVCM